jgi:phosphoacetylglucosamine mutase
MIHAARDTARDAGDAPKEAAATRVLLVKQLINQAIGDALSDLLLVEGILSHRGWGLAEWDDLYEDLPSRQTKLAVADRTALTVSDDETRTLVPAALQVQLDALAAATECGRCFVRPSGTEDVVRVYAEAKSVEAADALALQVAQATWRLAGGVGEMPTSV